MNIAKLPNCAKVQGKSGRGAKRTGGKMNRILSDIKEIDHIIATLQKIKTELESGRFIQAYRDCGSLLSQFMNHREEVLKEATHNAK